jgi:L-amino acid N-acyltransferase YncA
MTILADGWTRTTESSGSARLVPMRPIHALDLYRLTLDDGPGTAEYGSVDVGAYQRTRQQVLRLTMGLRAGRGCALTLVSGGQVAGLAVVSDVVRADTCRASVFVAVDRQQRGLGLGSAALAHACAVATDLGVRRMECAVLPTNTAARRLLSRGGFLEIGLARSYRMVDGHWADHVLCERLLVAA